MTGRLDRLLIRLGVQPGPFRALTAALVLMDLRSPHFAASTGTRSSFAITPLFWVVGQCLAISAIVSMALFLRCSVMMYSFVALSCSMLVLATSVLVEFHEVVFHPRDLEVIGPRPVSPRTFAAARFANLSFYVALIFGALNLFPAIVGAALDDAGPWYVPAYLTATVTGSLLTVCGVVLLLAALGRSEAVEEWKAILAWTQIAVFAVAAYGGQLMFRGAGHATEVWLAFPPDWVHWLPPMWLSSFVDRACDALGIELLGIGALMLLTTAGVCAMTVWRISSLYELMQPLPLAMARRTMPAERIGTLLRPGSRLVASTREQRVGFWLCSRALWQNASLRMRCLYPLNLAFAAALVGVLAGQFGNPMTTNDVSQSALSVLAVQLTVLAVPVILLNLTFSESHASSWVLRASPLADASGIAFGGARAVQLWVVTPVCLVLGGIMLIAWGDPWSALLHTVLTWLLCWLAAVASLLLVVPDLPLSRPEVRAGSLGSAVLPLLGFSMAAALIGGLHYRFASSMVFWLATGAGAIVASAVVARLARRRLNELVTAGA